MKCVKCASENVCKNGFISEKQRYKCKNCGYNFTKGRPSKPLHLKRLALQLYLEGLGFRSIGKVLKVSHVSVHNWIRNFGQKIEELRKNNEISIVKIDEMHTFIGSKKTAVGSGFLLIGFEKSSSTSLLVIGESKTEKSSITQ
jgi:transposase